MPTDACLCGFFGSCAFPVPPGQHKRSHGVTYGYSHLNMGWKEGSERILCNCDTRGPHSKPYLGRNPENGSPTSGLSVGGINDASPRRPCSHWAFMETPEVQDIQLKRSTKEEPSQDVQLLYGPLLGLP